MFSYNTVAGLHGNKERTVHMKNIKIAFIGGDKRMFYCAEALGEKGFECALYGFDEISDRANSTRCANCGDCLINSSALVLPLPISRDGINVNCINRKIPISDILKKCPEEVPIFGGNVTEKVKTLAKQYNRTISDYFDDDVLTEKNAMVTAEGALMLAMQNTERAIFGSKCLISGYGRIGQYTARIFSGLGARVTVMARRELSRIKAQLDGYSSISGDELSEQISDFDIILNTVPATVYSERELSRMKSSQIYIELASAPFGLEKKNADKYNVEIVDGSALPSRYCPKTAGEYISDKLCFEFERSGIV